MKNGKKKKYFISVTVKKELYDEFRRIARRQRRTIVACVDEMLKDYIKKWKKRFYRNENEEAVSDEY